MTQVGSDVTGLDGVPNSSIRSVAKSCPNGIADSWGHTLYERAGCRQRARMLLTPKIRIFAIMALLTYAALRVSYAVSGLMSTPTIIARVLCAACTIMCSFSLWINVAPRAVRALISRPRYALTHGRFQHPALNMEDNLCPGSSILSRRSSWQNVLTQL